LKKFYLCKLCLIVFGALLAVQSVIAEPIYHEVSYPQGDGPFPAVVLLHTSGGFKTVKGQIRKYTSAGYAVYAPDFFKRHGITKTNRFETWTTYRTQIEQEMVELISLMKIDPKVDPTNLYAVGFSNGGYWASFLAAKQYVNASSSHYGVWSFPQHNGYPADYFDTNSNPVLALHGDLDSIQKPRFVYRQLKKTASKSPKFEQFIFDKAGHSWDCVRCKKDGYDQQVSDKALEMTLSFFEKYRKPH